MFQLPLLYYTLSGLINFLTSSLLALFVLFKNPKTVVNQLWSAWCFSVAFWAFFYFLWLIQNDSVLAEFYVRTLMIGASFIPSIFTHFVTCWLQQSVKRRWLVINYGISLFFALNVYSPLFITSVENHLVFPHWPIAGILLHLQLFHFVLNVIYAHSLMIIALRKATDIPKRQIRYVLIGTSIAYLGGLTNYFLWYRIPIPPFLNPLVSVYVISVSYAIIRYRLLDITLIFRRTLVYTILISTISVVYLLTVLVTEKWFQAFLGYRSIAGTLVAAVLIAFAFQPFKQWLESWLDRHFFKHSHRELLRQNEQLQHQLRHSEKLAVIGQFAAAMVHEIRNPLAAIKTFADHFPQRKSDPVFLNQFPVCHRQARNPLS